MIDGPHADRPRQPHLPLRSIGGPPQDKKYEGEPTRLEIGDRNTIREYCTINRGTAQDVGVTRVGNDNWIMAYVHFAHDCQVGKQHHLRQPRPARRPRHVGDWAILGGFTRRAPVRAHRRARDDRHAGRAAAGRAAVRHGRGQPAQALRHQQRGPEAARLLARGDRGAQARLQDALPKRALARASAQAELEAQAAAGRRRVARSSNSSRPRKRGIIRVGGAIAVLRRPHRDGRRRGVGRPARRRS